MLVTCLVGAAVLNALPVGKPPTLRHAIVAAGMPTSNAAIQNLDKPITGWSWECDGNSYAAAYYLDDGSPDSFTKLWIARYDDGKNAWKEVSYEPPSSTSIQVAAEQVIALFFDEYYLYLDMPDAQGRVATWQFSHDLAYRNAFDGTTLASIVDWRLLYQKTGAAAGLNGLEGVYVFDPDSGTSRQIFPPAVRPPIESAADAAIVSEFKACGAEALQSHGSAGDPAIGLRSVGGAQSDLDTDAIAFVVHYGGEPFDCPASHYSASAVYVYLHPGDPAHMRFIEKALPAQSKFTAADEQALLAKASLAVMFPGT